jgi:hypothetical protein
LLAQALTLGRKSEVSIDTPSFMVRFLSITIGEFEAATAFEILVIGNTNVKKSAPVILNIERILRFLARTG